MPAGRAELRVGMIGAGWVTQHHLAGWKRLGRHARVVAIADPADIRARERASAFGIERVYRDAGQMLDEGGIDAVDIAAPREFHADLVRMATARGLQVLCQKPLAPTYGEAVALVSEVENRSRLMVHENWRFRPHIGAHPGCRR
jgi:predicted dehydrogenase